MKSYIAIHRHEWGTSYRVFRSDEDIMPIWYGCQNNSDPEADVGPVVQFAKRLGIQFEGSKGEELTVEPLVVPPDAENLSFAGVEDQWED